MYSFCSAILSIGGWGLSAVLAGLGRECSLGVAIFFVECSNLRPWSLNCVFALMLRDLAQKVSVQERIQEGWALRPDPLKNLFTL